MAPTPQARFRLLQQFEDFYVEIFRLRQQARQGAANHEVSPPLGGNPEDNLSGDAIGNAIWTSVAQLLDRKFADDKNAADISAAAELQRELLYLMAAFADESFVRMDWPGRPHWQANLLEQRLFHSSVAGERIFTNIDAALARQDDAAKELANAYLAALVLGFTGRYAEPDDLGAVEYYRRKLESALQPFNAESSPPVLSVGRVESGQRQTPKNLLDQRGQPSQVDAASAIQSGSNAKREHNSASPARPAFARLTRGLLIAVVAFAAGIATGLLISSRVPRGSLGHTATSPVASGQVEPFTIEVGTFQAQDSAIRLAESLRNLGYRPEIVERKDSDNRSWMVVRVGYYPNWQAALSAARQLSSKNLGLEPYVRPLR